MYIYSNYKPYKTKIMKNHENFGSGVLSRAELKEIKGGTTAACEAAYTACHANCAAGYSPTGYYAFAACINNANVPPCSPLAGWSEICHQ